MLFERRLLVAAVLAWIAAGIANLVTGPMLGHDEATFALIARESASHDWLYKSRGVTLLAEIGIAVGGADWQMRLPFFLFNIGFVLAAFGVGRAAFDARTGAWVAAVLATAHPLLVRNTQVLGDIPAAAAMLAGIAIVVGELDRDGGPRRRLLLAAPAFAAAFYLRYGHAPIIAVAVVLAPCVWWGAALHRPRLVLATGGLLATLLVPHMLHSLEQTDTVLGVLLHSAVVPRRFYVGQGLVDYFTSNPFAYYGACVAPLMLAGLVGVIALRVLRRRAPAYLVAVALAQLVLLGIQSHGQPRYVFVAAALLAVVGVAAVRTMLPRPRIALGVLALAWLGATIASVVLNTRIVERRDSIVAATDTIRAHGVRPCMLIAGVVQNQLGWYTGCDPTEDRLVQRWMLVGRAGYFVQTDYPTNHHIEDVHQYAAHFGIELVRELPTRDPKTRVWVIRGPAQ